MTVEDKVKTTSPVEDKKWLSCDGRQLKKLAQAGLVELEENYRAINELNVFPVPDGDTGTNMLLTMRAAIKQIENMDEAHVGRVSHELSHGALMGARGNSGVILSQIWRGFSKSLQDKELFNSDELAAALLEASETAYKGVMRPVEGTILTVIREGAEEAQDTIAKSQDLRFMLARVIERCEQALERTPDMLPVLKQAGVVDAGGKGLLVILEGMQRYVAGEVELEATAEEKFESIPAQALAAPEGGVENPYDVQFILQGNGLDVRDIRETIGMMGDSGLIVGDESLIKVHIHVKDPGQPLSYGITKGMVTDVVVENMQLQMEEIIGAVAAEPSSQPEIVVQEGEIGVVAVASGKGLERIFQSLGVAGIVDGGQSNNPSTEEILAIIQDLPTDKVIVLPNNKNIILAAEAARDLSPKAVVVVPTRSVPQGVSALLSLDRQGDLHQVALEMTEAGEAISSGEITIATRSTSLNGVSVNEGEIIGIVNGRLCTANSDLIYVLENVLEAMEMEDKELISVYYGADVTEEEAEEVAEQIEELYPEVEVELLPGGQAIYRYILGAE